MERLEVLKVTIKKELLLEHTANIADQQYLIKWRNPGTIFCCTDPFQFGRYWLQPGWLPWWKQRCPTIGWLCLIRGKKKQTNILLKSSAGIGLSSDDVGVSGAFLPAFLFWFPTKKRTQRLLIWDMRALLLLIKEEEFKRVKNIKMIDILKKWMKNAWRWWKTHGGWNRSKYECFINQNYVRSLV